MLLERPDFAEEDAEVAAWAEKNGLGKETTAELRQFLKQKLHVSDELISPQLNGSLMVHVAAFYHVSYREAKDVDANGGTLVWRIAYDFLCQLKVMLKAHHAKEQSAGRAECPMVVDAEVFAALVAPKQRNAPVSDSQEFCMD